MSKDSIFFMNVPLTNDFTADSHKRTNPLRTKEHFRKETKINRKDTQKMAKRSSGLGRGLDAIFLDNTLMNDSANKESTISTLNISLVDPKSDQPRKYFDADALEELANSIKENGLLQPILVREYGNGRYQIIAGERRFRASRLAELEEIPAIILDRDDKAAAQIALIENIQRENLNPLEEALAFKSLKEEYDMTQEELSDRLGKSRSAIANSLRLLDLPEAILAMVASRKLSAGHARTLLGVKDRDNMILLAEITVERDLSVRQLEEEVKKMNRSAKKAAEDDSDKKEPIVDYFREMELKIQRHLGRRAKIEDKGKKKTLTLYYEDNEDLDELLSLICGKAFLDEL